MTVKHYIYTQVIWKRLYSCSSGIDGGTLYQLRNLINRRNVTKDPATNVSACEDFFIHVVEVHILSVFMTAFKMSSLDDKPSTEIFPSDLTEGNASVRQTCLLNAIQCVLHDHVDMSICDAEQKVKERDDDHILSYARDVLSLGLFYMEFQDAVKEGDGERILRCWHYLLLVFKASGRSNYSVEAFTLLAQYHFTFSERMRKQLIWNRTINAHGLRGKNIACDLHMEHLNRECKGSISGLGANITDNAILRVGKSLRSSASILDEFDKLNNIKPQSGHHTARASDADISKLLKQLHTESKVFVEIAGRHHRNYPDFESNVMKKLKKSDLLQWFQDRYERLITYH